MSFSLPIFGHLSLNEALIVCAGGLATVFFVGWTIGQDKPDYLIEEGDQAGLTGLQNLGNTCFVNALLQAFAEVPLFQETLRRLLNVSVRDNPSESLLAELYSVLQALSQNQQALAEVGPLLQKINLAAKGLVNFGQQDCYELFTVITSALSDAVTARKVSDLSASSLERFNQRLPFENSLQGFMRSSFTCTACSTESSIKAIPFNDLSLQIHSPFVNSLQSAIARFEKEQQIQDYHCSHCAIRSRKGVLLHIQKHVGQESVRQITRQLVQFLDSIASEDLSYKEVERAYSKVTAKFVGQMGININLEQRVLAPLLPESQTISKQTVITQYPKVLVIHFKRLMINPYDGQPELIRKKVNITPFIELGRAKHKYQLRSVVAHVGDEAMGHYYAFRKRPQGWYVVSDTFHRSASWQEVLTHLPYLMFYQRL